MVRIMEKENPRCLKCGEKTKLLKEINQLRNENERLNENYISAVNGRREFRAALREAKNQIAVLKGSGRDNMKTKDCPFCFREIDADSTECPGCGVAFKKSYREKKECRKHACGKGDQARRTESDYEGGYVD